MKRLLACALLFLLTLSACAPLQSWDPEAWFPLWEDPEEPPACRETAAMWFQQVRPFELDALDLKRLASDFVGVELSLLHMKLLTKEDIWLPSAPGWWIDYYYRGSWYTVYREQFLWKVDRMVVYGRMAGLSDAGFAMPAKVLEKPGHYRLCYKGLGTFSFMIWG